MLQAGITFIAATLGSIIGAYLTLRINRSKHLQELRSAAYVDFLRGFAMVVIAQQSEQADAEREGFAIVTDAKARIGIYGSAEVVRALSEFASRGTQTQTPEGRHALARMCELMRKESGGVSVGVEDISRVLYGAS
jgi:hypothetical protein